VTHLAIQDGWQNGGEAETVDVHLIVCLQLSGKCIEEGLRAITGQNLLDKICWIKFTG
jgi:hypothetical protein